MIYDYEVGDKLIEYKHSSIEVKSFGSRGASTTSSILHAKNDGVGSIFPSSASKGPGPSTLATAGGLPSRARIDSLRKELVQDLRDPAEVDHTSEAWEYHSQSPGRRVSKADSRPVSPSSPCLRMPVKPHNTYMSLTMNVMISSVGRAVDGDNRRAAQAFFAELRRMNGRFQSVKKMDALLTRKRLNRMFTTFATLKQREPLHECCRRFTGPIIQSASTMSQASMLPPCLSELQSEVSTYVALGKVLGVVLSVHRVFKLWAFRQFRINNSLNIGYRVT